jgi:hypothetical protein
MSRFQKLKYKWCGHPMDCVWSGKGFRDFFKTFKNKNIKQKYITGRAISPEVFYQKFLAILEIFADISTFGDMRTEINLFVQKLKKRRRSK